MIFRKMTSLDLNGRDKSDSNGRERHSEDKDEVDTDGVTIIIHEKQGRNKVNRTTEAQLCHSSNH